jgi:hypothetical protein
VKLPTVASYGAFKNNNSEKLRNGVEKVEFSKVTYLIASKFLNLEIVTFRSLQNPHPRLDSIQRRSYFEGKIV